MPDSSPSCATEIAVENLSRKAKQKHLPAMDDNLELKLTRQELFKVCGFIVNLAANGVRTFKLMHEHAVDAVVNGLLGTRGSVFGWE